MAEEENRASSWYNLKRAVVDLGFINGYFYANEPSELLLGVLDRIEALALRGFDETDDRNVEMSFLHELGCLRGLAWTRPIPYAVSEAMLRVTHFFIGQPELPCEGLKVEVCEPLHELLSDDTRDKVLNHVIAGCDPFKPELAQSLGVNQDAVSHFFTEATGVKPEDLEDDGKPPPPALSRAESVEQSAEQKQGPAPGRVGDRTREPAATYANRQDWHYPIPDDQVEAVRKMAETMTDQEIGAQFGTSRWTVIDYRAKHGIKKRKGKRPVDADAQEPEPEEQNQESVTSAVSDPPVPPAAGYNPFNPSGKRGQREWTPEQRAAQSARAKELHKNKTALIADSDFEAVKADFDAGISFDAIGRKYRCSGSHVRNFLKKHGVDPRRTVVAAPAHKAEEKGEPGYEEHAAERMEIIREMSGKGWKDKEIGEALGHTTGYISQIRNANGIPSGSQQRNKVANGGRSASVNGNPIQRPRLHTPLKPDDWPEIKGMLDDGASRATIAGDFDVPVEELDAFIREHSPGEARAPLASMRVGAA